MIDDRFAADVDDLVFGEVLAADEAMMVAALDQAIETSIEEIAEDVFTVDPIAMDEFNESKVKRDKDGKFSETGGGGSGGEGEAAPAKTFGTKKEHIAHLLTEGTTPKDLMTAMGWPSVSMPAQAEALKMKLEKKDGKYFGTPMTGEEWQSYLKDKAEKIKQKAASKTPSPETLPGSSAGQPKDLGSMAGQTAPKLTDIPKGPEPGKPPQDYSQFLGALAEAAQKKDKVSIEGLLKYNPEWAKHFANNATAAGKAALEKAVPGVLGTVTKAPQATSEELKKAAKSTSLPMNATSPGGAQVIKDFNEKYAGKDNLSAEQLNQKVQDHKDMTKAVKQIDAEHASATAAEKKAAEKKSQEEAQKKIADKLAKEKAEMQAKFDADPELQLHYEAAEALFGGKDTGSGYMTQATNKVKAAGMSKIIDGAAALPIIAYSGSHYGKVNEQLRSGQMTKPQFLFMKSLNAGLDKLPAHTGTTFRKASLPSDLLALYQPGHIVEERGFTSSSKVEGTWSGNTDFTIHGKSGRDIQKLSSHPSEAEVLFKSGTRFEIISRKGNHIEMREV